jgi:hypothetical protein
MTVEVTGNELLQLVDQVIAENNGVSFADAFEFSDYVDELEDVNYALSA